MARPWQTPCALFMVGLALASLGPGAASSPSAPVEATAALTGTPHAGETVTLHVTLTFHQGANGTLALLGTGPVTVVDEDPWTLDAAGGETRERTFQLRIDDAGFWSVGFERVEEDWFAWPDHCCVYGWSTDGDGAAGRSPYGVDWTREPRPAFDGNVVAEVIDSERVRVRYDVTARNELASGLNVDAWVGQGTVVADPGSRAVPVDRGPERVVDLASGEAVQLSAQATWTHDYAPPSGLDGNYTLPTGPASGEADCVNLVLERTGDEVAIQETACTGLAAEVQAPLPASLALASAGLAAVALAFVRRPAGPARWPCRTRRR